MFGNFWKMFWRNFWTNFWTNFWRNFWRNFGEIFGEIFNIFGKFFWIFLENLFGNFCKKVFENFWKFFENRHLLCKNLILFYIKLYEFLRFLIFERIIILTFSINEDFLNFDILIVGSIF